MPNSDTSTRKGPMRVTKPRRPAKPTNVRAGTMAAYMDSLLLASDSTDAKTLVRKLKVTTRRRGLATPPTLGTLRAHLRFRQAHGQLKEVKAPEYQ